MADASFRLDGLKETVSNMDELSRATQRNAMRRVLLRAGEPTADAASRLAPEERGILAFSIVVSPNLTRRHKGEQRNRASEVEVYIGPSGGLGALYYASHQEFGTVLMPGRPYLRPAWASTKGQALNLIVDGLKAEVAKSAARAARKAARFAAKG
jgi:HK97 gp10 family phage protein